MFLHPCYRLQLFWLGVKALRLFWGQAIHEAVKQGDVSTVREAAESGNAEAQFFSGLMYEKGAGVEELQADAWYRKAARQGHALAQNNLRVYVYPR